MAASVQTTVKITFDKGTNAPKCHKDWVNCFWEKQGEEDIRWTFEGFPPNIAFVGVTFLPFVPSKCGKAIPGFLDSPPFLGVGQVPGTGTAGLPDLQTYGNLRKKGYFCYSLQFYDKDMTQIYVLDPGGTNDPLPPSGQHP